MSRLTIRNIIFDLGGVILNIDPQLTVDGFRNLGWHRFYEEGSRSVVKELFYNLEKGNSSPGMFRDYIRHMVDHQLNDYEIDIAWSAMILDIPPENIRYLEQLKNHYRLFLLSNTNEIHRIKIHRNFEAVFGYSFYELFERNFYSHEMGMRKPDPQIFIQALTEAYLIPEETLFIDDMKENTDAAKRLGIKVLHIQPGTMLEYLPGYLTANQGRI
jgi:HAD superfamily hydrolase (TIGR01509 family)